jgi:hypothetical protein
LGQIEYLPETILFNDFKHIQRNSFGVLCIINFKLTNSQIKKWKIFKENLLKGINYYESLFEISDFFKEDLIINRQLQQY